MRQTRPRASPSRLRSRLNASKSRHLSTIPATLPANSALRNSATPVRLAYRFACVRRLNRPPIKRDRAREAESRSAPGFANDKRASDERDFVKSDARISIRQPLAPLPDRLRNKAGCIEHEGRERGSRPGKESAHASTVDTRRRLNCCRRQSERLC